MLHSRPIRNVTLTVALSLGMLAAAVALHAAAFPEFVDPHPAPGNQFGAIIVPLATGNVVITSPGDDLGGSDAGAVYLFNGATGTLISTLRGSHANDAVGGSGVTALANGNFVVVSPSWNSTLGAATWGSGTTGVSGIVASSNSLVGSAAADQVSSGGVIALANGNYVVRSPTCDNGAVNVAGAVTWCDGTTGRVGAVSAANSLVGSTAVDQVGSGGVTALTNGNYVVASPLWNSGGVSDVGAVIWCNGVTGRVGGISAANSLVGSTTSDEVGLGGVTALSNGNYVVVSRLWNNGAVVDAGAVTWADGTVGRVGAVTAGNSLVGTAGSDQAGSGGVTALTNGNFVVASPLWNNGGILDAGAATWGWGLAGATGAISAANSLVGSTATDEVSSSGVAALTNGNYVVASHLWNNAGIVDAGAATWADGTTGLTGAVSAANSLVGSSGQDQVGLDGVTALTNGNYVVRSGSWNNGGQIDVGAVTWGNGTTGITGAVSAANSLVGSTIADGVGGGNSVTPLTNGNYVVRSWNWSNGGVSGAGAATWGNGTIGVSGVITAANSLVGSTAFDRVSFAGVTALANGNYVVQSHNWDGDDVDVGAVTWGSGTTGVTGEISAANSLVGSQLDDEVGLNGVTALSDGNYVVTSPTWDNGTLTDAGAVTWGDGTTGVTGTIPNRTSMVAGVANTGLTMAIEDPVNGNFISTFATEGGGRIRVGPPSPFELVSALDIPGDQGGWLRLTFLRHYLDHVNGSPAVTSYGVWRHIPGTFTPFTAFPTGESAATFPPGTWELVTSVPAVQQNQYVVAVPTISNAAANDYVVTAHTTIPSLWVVTAPISGQSVDNLAPAQPQQLTAAYANGQTDLQWAANSEPDIGSYSLHRGASAGFTPTPGNRIASQIGTSYSDVGPAGSYYKLCAVDVNGNQSGFALITPQQTTDVDGGEAVTFAIQGIRPNPASGRELLVAFALPSAEPARLELLDVSGRLVLSRDAARGAGRHVVNLVEGRRVRTGIYWVRLVQGQNRATTRAAVVE
jgi:hypothetical protein